MSEKELKKKRELAFPVNGLMALRIVLEDSQTSSFIRTYFSPPAQNPDIFSRKELSRSNRGFRWIVEIIEKIHFFNGRVEIMNIARVEVSPYCGRIFKRHLLRSILKDEYEKIFDKSSSQTASPKRL